MPRHRGDILLVFGYPQQQSADLWQVKGIDGNVARFIHAKLRLELAPQSAMVSASKYYFNLILHVPQGVESHGPSEISVLGTNQGSGIKMIQQVKAWVL